MTSVSSLHDAGHPKLVLWDDLEGWGRKEGGSGHMYTYGPFMLMYGKTHHNIVNYPPITINTFKNICQVNG